ncbi:MAG: hypothetical protein RLN70_12680 [Rhodospirillaceae bacterium]
MKTFANNKLITCIMPRGQGPELVEALHADHGITSANVLNGRGISERKKFFAEEVDVVTVVVNQSRADEIFAFIHERADVSGARGRFMYQQPLDLSSSFMLPDSLEFEEADAG